MMWTNFFSRTVVGLPTPRHRALRLLTHWKSPATTASVLYLGPACIFQVDRTDRGARAALAVTALLMRHGWNTDNMPRR